MSFYEQSGTALHFCASLWGLFGFLQLLLFNMFQCSMLCILWKTPLCTSEKMQVKNANNILALYKYTFHLTGPAERALGHLLRTSPLQSYWDGRTSSTEGRRGLWLFLLHISMSFLIFFNNEHNPSVILKHTQK